MSKMTPEQFYATATAIEQEIGRFIVGQQQLIRYTLITLLAGGNALLEGVPGLGKTMLVRTMSEVMDIGFSRIQFTPDLMPADIVGTNIIAENEQGRRQFEPGPIFSNLVLADEINRATPKTQSAMLEAMQERTVTVAKEIHQLPKPFFVLATQNPLEMEGTYPLPKAQLDRFFFKIDVPFPSVEDLVTIAKRTTGVEEIQLNKVADGQTIMQMQQVARTTPVASHVLAYAARILAATHPLNVLATSSVLQYVRFGSSPRGLQAMILAGKILALLDGRFNVAFDDIQAATKAALRHRLILNFEAQAENISSDSIVEQILRDVPTELMI